MPDIYEDFDYRTWQKAWDYAQKAEVYKANAGDDLDALLEQSKTQHDQILEKLRSWLPRKLGAPCAPIGTRWVRCAWSAKISRESERARAPKVEQYRSTARELLADGVEAVPVWVMPIANAITQFDASNPFDLVIIDEASQAEMKLLPIMLLGKKMLIVGDSNQVSPMSTNDDPEARLRANATWTASVVEKRGSPLIPSMTWPTPTSRTYCSRSISVAFRTSSVFKQAELQRENYPASPG